MSNREILKKKIETAKNQTPKRRIELKIYADIPQYLKIEDLEQYLYHRMKYNIDIKKEFPEEMAKGAEKYFKQNYTCIDCNRLLLTTTANNENNGE